MRDITNIYWNRFHNHMRHAINRMIKAYTYSIGLSRRLLRCSISITEMWKISFGSNVHAAYVRSKMDGLITFEMPFSWCWLPLRSIYDVEREQWQNGIDFAPCVHALTHRKNLSGSIEAYNKWIMIHSLFIQSIIHLRLRLRHADWSSVCKESANLRNVSNNTARCVDCVYVI